MEATVAIIRRIKTDEPHQSSLARHYRTRLFRQTVLGIGGDCHVRESYAGFATGQ